MSRPLKRSVLRALALCGVVSAAHALPVGAQSGIRARIDGIDTPRLRFRPPSPRLEDVSGVPVYFLEDPSLPLVTLYATFKGGYARLPREYYGAANAVPALLRTGGTRSLPPDSVDHRIEFYALQTSFGQGGGSVSSWVNTLSENVEEAASLWGEMLREPSFDSAQVEVWRGAEVERTSRRRDDPASLAFSRFNRIMFGDHPVGWELGPADLEQDDLTTERLQFVHRAVVCPDDMVLGVVGNISWEDARATIETLLADWPPCSGALIDEPVPELRRTPGVFVIHKEIEQAVVVLAHPSELRQSDAPEFFAAQIGNSILGASGFSSRLTTQLRTKAGLAYSASSLWTTSKNRDGLVGAITRTKPETALTAARLIMAEMDSIRSFGPETDEVSLAVDEIANGFVFNFETPFQVVSRSIAFRNLDLPADWLERYVEGIQDVTPINVQRAFEKHLHPTRMTVLLVGDTTRFDGSASELGPVTVLEEVPSVPRVPPQSRP